MLEDAANRLNQTEHPLKSFPGGRGHPCAAAEIAIDDLDVLPTQATCPLSQLILKPLAFKVLPNLLFTGLPDLDDCLATQVFWLDLGTV